MSEKDKIDDNDKPKNKGGRPKKKLDCLPVGWEDEVVRMGEKGCSDIELRDYLNISDDLWYRFLEEEPKFSQAIKKARTKCQIWWEKTGRNGCFMGGKDNPFNPTVWIFNMKNRFNWRDKIETNNNVSLTDEIKELSDKLPD